MQACRPTGLPCQAPGWGVLCPAWRVVPAAPEVAGRSNVVARRVWRRPIGLGWSSFSVVGGREWTQEQVNNEFMRRILANQKAVCPQCTGVYLAFKNMLDFSSTKARGRRLLQSGNVYEVCTLLALKMHGHVL